MAKKKAKAKAKAKVHAETVTLKLPAGFKKLSAGDYAELWDYENQAELVGEVSRIDSVTTGKGKSQKDTRIMEVTTDEGAYAVWECYALRTLFDSAQIGDRVWIGFEGFRDIPGRSLPMKVFQSAIEEGPPKKRRRK